MPRPRAQLADLGRDEWGSLHSGSTQTTVTQGSIPQTAVRRKKGGKRTPPHLKFQGKAFGFLDT